MILLCRLEVEYPRMHHRLEKTTFIYIFFTDFWGDCIVFSYNFCCNKHDRMGPGSVHNVVK